MRKKFYESEFLLTKIRRLIQNSYDTAVMYIYILYYFQFISAKIK